MELNHRLRVLIVAYACSPYKGSEPGVGWGFVSELAKHHDLWIIVEEEKFRDDIQRYLKANPQISKSARFFFIKKKRNRILRKLWPPSYYWYYRQWHLEALKLARELHLNVGFDLVHQLTMVGFREPGYLWKLGVPFVWGPLGGMGFFPWRFLPKVGFYGALYYLGYNLFNFMQMHYMKRPRLAALAARSGLIVATQENRIAAERLWGCSSTVLAEVGLPNDRIGKICNRQPNEKFKIVWAGQHTPGKALNLGLEALAVLPIGLSWEMNILGQGGRMLAWKRMATRIGLKERCHFHGWMVREKALEIISSAHVMLITSLRDLTSTVTIEAMALGVPIICLDHCGFSNVVDDTCGIKVPVTTPKDVIKGLSNALARLAEDEFFRQHLVKGALKRAQEFSWPNKAEVMRRIYAARLKEADHENR